MLIPFPASFDPGSLQQLLDTHLVPPEPVKIEYTFSPRTAVREIHDVEVEMVRAKAPESIIPLLPPVSHEEHALGSIHPLCRYPNSTSLCLSSSSVLKYLSIVRPNPRIRLVALFWVLLLPTAADNYAFCLRHTVSHMRVRGGRRSTITLRRESTTSVTMKWGSWSSLTTRLVPPSRSSPSCAPAPPACRPPAAASATVERSRRAVYAGVGV